MVFLIPEEGMAAEVSLLLVIFQSVSASAKPSQLRGMGTVALKQRIWEVKVLCVSYVHARLRYKYFIGTGGR